MAVILKIDGAYHNVGSSSAYEIVQILQGKSPTPSEGLKQYAMKRVRQWDDTGTLNLGGERSDPNEWASRFGYLDLDRSEEGSPVIEGQFFQFLLKPKS